MRYRFADRRIRLITGSVAGLLVCGIVFFDQPYILEFIGYAVFSAIPSALIVEAMYRIWLWADTDNRILKGCMIVVTIGLLFVSMIGLLLVETSVSGDMFGCLKYNPEPAQNTLTGSCEMIQRDCSPDRDIPWYYEDGCERTGVSPPDMCLERIRDQCELGKESIELSGNCAGSEYDYPYAVENGTLFCDQPE